MDMSEEMIHKLIDATVDRQCEFASRMIIMINAYWERKITKEQFDEYWNSTKEGLDKTYEMVPMIDVLGEDTLLDRMINDLNGGE